MFLLAWLIGAVGLVLSGEVDEGWLALLLVAGLTLVFLGARLWRDRRAWLAFVESQSRLLPQPSGRSAQRYTPAGIVVVGLGWLLGGIAGLHALLT
jgi:hypothetical protein